MKEKLKLFTKGFLRVIRSCLSLSIVFSMLLSSFINVAMAEPKTALQVMLSVESQNKGYISEQSQLKLVLLDSSSLRIERDLKVTNFEKSKDLEYFLLEFINPKDVRGTKVLTWSHRNKVDDQWIYLPSLKKPKRIIGSNRSSSFMGSEFTYEDFTGTFADKYEYGTLVEDKTTNDLIWVFERTPKEKMSYAKQKVYISKKYMGPIKIEYFNANGKKYKQASFENFKSFDVKGRQMFRSLSVTMENLINQRKSILIWSDRNLGVKINPAVFRSNTLGR